MNDARHDAATVPPRLLSRERAILEFNRRVLAQARRDDVPLLERLRYITIVSSNLDEFFEVRFADLDPALRQRVVDECLVPYLHDRRDAWLQQPDGGYARIADDGVSAQQALMARFS